jgi:butyryl-CoA:acetate CoA-transferase
MDFTNEYRRKLKTPEEAVKLVKSGDWVEYPSGTNFPVLCDAALAKRRDELTDVKVRGQVIGGPIEIAECDPTQEHFIYNSWHCSGYERSLCDRGLCYYESMTFRNLHWYYQNFLKVNLAFACVTPMDEHGYFNFSIAAGMTRAGLDVADIIVLEINENLPKIYGGVGESIHISDVDCIVEGPHGPIFQAPSKAPTAIDIKIAENIIPYIVNGSALQLGIGGMPDAVGKILAQSDLKDLGMHTEMCSDAYLALFEAGKLTNLKKNIDTGKGVMGFASGTQPLYDWLNDNPGVITYPVSYVNSPEVIGQLENFVSINSCVSIDLYGQICSESAGTRHISGTGGQLDFVTGAAMSKGGKSFVCTPATFTDKSGKTRSRIVPHFNGDIVTVPRSQAYYIATEYGAVNLAGKSAWERAELLVSAAAPEFRDDLVKAAQEQSIWRKSNKR